ncbi:MAG: ETC complex I subunit [Alphaproteobacteria bacterium]
MQVRIYRPSRTAMQSGEALTRKWALEFEPASARRKSPLMGWTSSADTQTQVRLSFDTLDEAVAFARREGYAYTVDMPHAPRRRPKSYAENFRYNRPA